MNNQKITQDAFELFLSISEENIKSNNELEKVKQNIILEKNKKLLPIRNLLRRFIELGLIVYNSQKYSLLPSDLKSVNNDKVLFSLERQYSYDKITEPCEDLIIQHPCFIRISVPNKKEIEEYGEIIFFIHETNCPHVELIKNKKFTSVEAACQAISKFLALNALDFKNKNQ